MKTKKQVHRCAAVDIKGNHCKSRKDTVSATYLLSSDYGYHVKTRAVEIYLCPKHRGED